MTIVVNFLREAFFFNLQFHLRGLIRAAPLAAYIHENGDLYSVFICRYFMGSVRDALTNS
jgi:hypothetical protein